MTTAAYGIRLIEKGKATVVQVIAKTERIRVGDYTGTRTVHLHRGVGTYKDRARAEARAQQLADAAGVPYVGTKADSY